MNDFNYKVTTHSDEGENVYYFCYRENVDIFIDNCDTECIEYDVEIID